MIATAVLNTKGVALCKRPPLNGHLNHKHWTGARRHPHPVHRSKAPYAPPATNTEPMRPSIVPVLTVLPSATLSTFTRLVDNQSPHSTHAPQHTQPTTSQRNSHSYHAPPTPQMPLTCWPPHMSLLRICSMPAWPTSTGAKEAVTTEGLVLDAALPVRLLSRPALLRAPTLGLLCPVPSVAVRESCAGLPTGRAPPTKPGEDEPGSRRPKGFLEYWILTPPRSLLVSTAP